MITHEIKFLPFCFKKGSLGVRVILLFSNGLLDIKRLLKGIFICSKIIQL
jgi:hypothetical protein